METASKSTENRPYQKHGLYAVRNAIQTGGENWLEGLGEVGLELKAWRASIVADMGGDDNISAMERAVIELAVKTHLMLSSVDRFLLEQGSLVNKSKRQLFPVVLQRQQLADALARYMAQLGLKRRSKPLSGLAELLRANTNPPQGESQHGDSHGA